jgi:hypothetical protein
MKYLSSKILLSYVFNMAFPVNLSSFNIIIKNQMLKGKYTLWQADKVLQKSATENHANCNILYSITSHGENQVYS